LAILAAFENGVTDVGLAVGRLLTLDPAGPDHATVEVAWTLAALSALCDPALNDVRDRVADRLLNTCGTTPTLFPHRTDKSGWRSHVTCFADQIYPIHALSMYAAAARNARALDAASAAGLHLCRLQGREGQWWWHYDFRTGVTLERYPVYAIHQDAMAPMGFFALYDAGGPDCRDAIARGLEWLAAPPELGGRSLVDEKAGVIWRKVSRHEPKKAVRYLQAGLSGLYPSLRVPGVDRLFPAGAIDYETRPYHLGWFLYAWRGARAASSTLQESPSCLPRRRPAISSAYRTPR
jgi:hypothetical protein